MALTRIYTRNFRFFPAVFVALTLWCSAQTTPLPCAKAPEGCATIIATQASASTRVPNTEADITLGIAASDKELAAVQRELAQGTASLLAYLRAQKVERLRTDQVNISPEQQTEKNAPMRVVGYSGNTSVSFRTTPARVAEILNGALSNGANTINSSSFTISEEQLRAARRELSSQAVRTAIAEANDVAKAANLHVVSIKSIDTNGQLPLNGRPRLYAAGSAGMGFAAQSIATEAGDQEITVSIDVQVAAKP